MADTDTFTQRLARLCALILGATGLIPAVAILAAIGFQPGYITRVEKRQPAALPALTPQTLVRQETFETLSAVVNDRFPFKGSLVELMTLLDIKLLGKTRFATVDVGRDGWLYLRASYGPPNLGYDSAAQEALAVLEAFLEQDSAIAASATQSRAKLRLVIAPDKHVIYPQYLTPQGQAEVARGQAARSLIRQWFQTRAAADPRLIDLWSVLEEQKFSELVYMANDTHHSPHGAWLMARAIVESIDPQAWYPQPLAEKSYIRDPGDLELLLGLNRYSVGEQRRYRAYQQPEMPEASVVVEQQTFASLAEANDDLCIARQLPPNCISHREKRFFNGGAATIAAKTLIVHDSFMEAFTLDLLVPLFREVTFVHFDEITPDDLRAAIDRYDYVVLESVERNAFWPNNSKDSRIVRFFGEMTADE